jgi:hypothetical protein
VLEEGKAGIEEEKWANVKIDQADLKGDYTHNHLINPQPLGSGGAFGTIYKAKYRYQGELVDVIVKYQFCKTLSEARDLENESKIGLRFQGDEKVVHIYDSFTEERHPGF